MFKNCLSFCVQCSIYCIISGFKWPYSQTCLSLQHIPAQVLWETYSIEQSKQCETSFTPLLSLYMCISRIWNLCTHCSIEIMNFLLLLASKHIMTRFAMGINTSIITTHSVTNGWKDYSFHGNDEIIKTSQGSLKCLQSESLYSLCLEQQPAPLRTTLACIVQFYYWCWPEYWLHFP